MFGRSWRNRNPLYTWLALAGACIVAVPAIWLALRAVIGAAPFAGLQPRAMELCRACSAAPMDGVSPYRIGQVLVVQPSGIPLGQLMADESLSSVLASRRGEVGTLACISEPYQVLTGASCHGEALYRIYREVCLVELSSGSVLYRTSLAGAKPYVST